MLDLIRDSPFGQLLNHASGGRILPFRDQRSDYVVPAHYLLPPNKSLRKAASAESDMSTTTRVENLDAGENMSNVTLNDVQLETGTAEKPAPAFDNAYLVDWDGPEDPDNPKWVIFFSTYRAR